jgi:hypothetical protein
MSSYSDDLPRNYIKAVEQIEKLKQQLQDYDIKNGKLEREKKELKQQLQVAIKCIEYYLPILEESLSCGAYVRQALEQIKTMVKE